jgi:hypothetical protein
MSILVGILMFIGTMASSQDATIENLSSQACEMRAAARQHVGEVITFKARYTSDGRSRARIDIIGCPHRYGVYDFADGLAKLMDPDVMVGYYPMRSIEARFTARNELVPPNTMTYQDDDGIRLNLLTATEIEAVPD